MNPWLAFALGVLAGALMVFAWSWMVAAGRADDQIERQR